MAEGKPGTGDKNPFGNGSGGTSMAKAGPVNFFVNPKGQGPGAPAPRDFANQKRAQPTGGDYALNPDSVPAGGKELHADPPADAGNPIGTTAGGGGNKPYKLGG